MLMRLGLIEVLLLGFCLTPGQGEEYLIRFDSIEHARDAEDDEQPEEKTLRSIEVTAREGEPFRAKAQFGKETLTFSGKFAANDEGGFIIDFRHHYALDTGETVLIAPNKRKPILNERKIHTRLAVKVGEPIVAGTMTTASQTPGQPRRIEETRLVLVVTKFEHADD